MKRLMISAMNSGSGKTVLCCGLLKAIQNRGISVEAFKCGPDYIDPMFHTTVLGIPGRNLDLFLQGTEGVKHSLKKQSADIAVIEGAMGFYDGIGGTEKGSAWEIAAQNDIPVIVAVRPKGASISLAAQIAGMKNFRSPSKICGIILTDCSAMLYEHLKPILERETGLAVFGYLPHMPEADFSSRHLGLVKPDEIKDFQHKISIIAELAEKYCDLSAILSICSEFETAEQETAPIKHCCRIAVARDKAFCFYYRDNLEALEENGAELVLFSPLHDTELPDCDGLYIGGGYPELYASELSENTSMLEALKDKIRDGLPTVAECGGFMYLQKELEDKSGAAYPMVGVLPGKAFPTDRLQRFGYLELTAEKDTMLLHAGETLPAHEFHYWDTDANGIAFSARKQNGRSWACAYADKNLYAAFPHLHFGGSLPLAERFVSAAAAYKEKQNDT